MSEFHFHLDTKQIEEFKSLGAICLRNVFDESWVQKVATGIEKNFANPSPFGEKLGGESDTSSALYFNDYCNWRSIPEFTDYVHNSPAAKIAGKLMESDYSAFYHEHVLVKEPGSSKETPWHVDQSYYPINGFKVCSIWMPVDPVGIQSTIQFVAGSHLWPEWFIPRKFATTLNYQRLRESESSHAVNYVDVPDAEEIEKNHTILKWEVNPGDCIVFHMKTLHGAPGNKSVTNSRRILSTRWLGDDATIDSRPWEISPPILGGLNVGDQAVSEDFPIIWRSRQNLNDLSNCNIVKRKNLFEV